MSCPPLIYYSGMKWGARWLCLHPSLPSASECIRQPISLSPPRSTGKLKNGMENYTAQLIGFPLVCSLLSPKGNFECAF